MENSTLDSNVDQDIHFSQSMKEYILSTAKWSRFLSILGFIGIGFMVIGAFTVGFFVNNSASAFGGGQSAMSGIPSFLFTVLYLIFAAIYFFPVYFLFKFSSNAIKAVNNNAQSQMEESLHNLKRHYQFIGILTIIVLSIYLLIFLIGIAGGTMLSGF